MESCRYFCSDSWWVTPFVDTLTVDWPEIEHAWELWRFISSFSEDLLFKGQTDLSEKYTICCYVALVFCSPCCFSFLLLHFHPWCAADSGSSGWRLWICLPIEWSIPQECHQLESYSCYYIPQALHYLSSQLTPSPVVTALQPRWHPCCHPTAAARSPHINTPDPQGTQTSPVSHSGESLRTSPALPPLFPSFFVQKWRIREERSVARLEK